MNKGAWNLEPNVPGGIFGWSKKTRIVHWAWENGDRAGRNAKNGRALGK